MLRGFSMPAWPIPLGKHEASTYHHQGGSPYQGFAHPNALQSTTRPVAVTGVANFAMSIVS